MLFNSVNDTAVLRSFPGKCKSSGTRCWVAIDRLDAIENNFQSHVGVAVVLFRTRSIKSRSSSSSIQHGLMDFDR